MEKISRTVFCSILYSVVDCIYVSLYYLGITNKQPQEIDPNFVRIIRIIFRGTGIVYFMLYIISCVKILINSHGSKCLTCNSDLVQYYKTKNLKIIILFNPFLMMINLTKETKKI